MPEFNFMWEETTVKKLTIPENEMIGVEVDYTSMCMHGKVLLDGGRLAILWDDGAETTYLDTEYGIMILKECKPF